MENVNRRPQSFVLKSPKNVHRAVRVGDFPFAESRIRGINDASGLVSGDHGDLVIQSLACRGNIAARGPEESGLE